MFALKVLDYIVYFIFGIILCCLDIKITSWGFWLLLGSMLLNSFVNRAIGEEER